MAAPSGKTPVLGLRFPIEDDTVDPPRDIQALAMDVEAFVQGFIGEIRMFGFSTPPVRWLACDGTIKLQADFPELYAKIGATWNVSGETAAQFRLPSLSGRTLVGMGAGTGLTTRAVATRWGVEAVVISTAQMPGHSHGGKTAMADRSLSHTHGFADAANGGGQFQGTGFENIIFASGSAWSANYRSNTGLELNNIDHQHVIPAEGSSQAHDNTQPSIAVPMHIYAGR